MQIHCYRTDTRDDVSVFSSALKIDSGHYDLLSPSEKLYTESIASETRRSRFIASRSFLRLAIGKFLCAPPYCGEFIVGSFGKLYLPKPNQRIFFNVSHTNKMILVACTTRRVVGVDIESSDRNISTNMLGHFCSPENVSHFSSAHDAVRDMLFGWVCREAVLKCIGSGLSRDPRSITLNCEKNDLPFFRTLDLSQKRMPVREFKIIHINHIVGVVGAIALHQLTKV